MGKIVTFPREKHASGEQMRFTDMKSEEDRAILARILLENVARWVDDRDRDVIVGMDMGGGGGTPRPALTDEECAELAKAGAGSWGHCTIIEPADLDLYESYMYAPLAMPEKPEVMVSYWDMNRGVAPFMEGRVMVKALCPRRDRILAGDQRPGAQLLYLCRRQLLGLAQVRVRRDDGGEGSFGSDL